MIYRALDCDFSTGQCPDCGKRSDRPIRRNCPVKLRAHPQAPPGQRIERPSPGRGPGTELLNLNAQLKIRPKRGCKCHALAVRMDELGIEGCRAHRVELLAALAENYQLYGRLDKLTAAVHALATGIAFRLDPRDPLGSLFDEALRRAQVAEASAGG
jgi:hypothetical protein